VQIGLITQLCWPRYGDFWQALLTDAGFTLITAPEDKLRSHLHDQQLEAVVSLPFKLAVAEALVLQQCDVLLVPRLNPTATTGRGAAQDPWITNFPETLGGLFRSLPPLLAVPATLEHDLETTATTILHTLTHDPGNVRRVWQRFRGRIKSYTPSVSTPHWQRGSDTTIGVVAQPWLLPLADRLERDGEYIISQGQLDVSMLRAEGARIDPALLETDLEVLGAARLMSRRGNVAKVRFLADTNSSADNWLARRMDDLLRKPFEIVPLETIASTDDLMQVLRPA
jgi:hypothetical protein